MKRKGFWALAAVLACGALAYLAISAASQVQDYTEKDLGEFKAKIKELRQTLGERANAANFDFTGIVNDNAMTINRQERAVSRGRAGVQEKWRRTKAQRTIRFDTAQSRIEFVPAKFMARSGGADWTSFNLIAIEFGSFTFTAEPGAEGGPAAVLPPPSGEYCAIWGHKENCPWEIFTEIEY